MTYHSHLDFNKIPDSKLAKEAIETNSLWLNAIYNHSNTYNIEDLYKGFKRELDYFIQMNGEIRKRLIEVENNDNIAEIEQIEKEAFDLKRQIDSSEMMRSFTFHRFQITMDCSEKGIVDNEIKEDTEVKKLLTIAKETITQNYDKRYEERYSK